MIIDMAPIINILVYYVFPVGFLVLLFAFIYVSFLLKTMPPAAFVLREAARTMKGVLTIIADDLGKLRFDVMSTDIGQGILSGDEINYLFTPRPTYEIPKQAVLKEDAQGNQRIEINQVELTEAEKASIDALNLYKHHMVGVQLPVLLGYAGKSMAATPKTLDYITTVHKVNQEIEEELKELPEKEREKERKKKFKVLKLLDPRIYKEYVKWTLGPAIIDALCLTHEMIGAEEIDRPSGLGRFIPIAILAVLVIFGIVLWQSGALDAFMGK